MSATIRRVLERNWVDERAVIHTQVLEISSNRSVRVLLACTNEPTPEWGMLAENYTTNPVTCLWCIAEEQQGDTTK